MRTTLKGSRTTKPASVVPLGILQNSSLIFLLLKTSTVT